MSPVSQDLWSCPKCNQGKLFPFQKPSEENSVYWMCTNPDCDYVKGKQLNDPLYQLSTNKKSKFEQWIHDKKV